MRSGANTAKDRGGAFATQMPTVQIGRLGQLTTAGLLPTALVYAKLFEAAIHAGLDRDPGCGQRAIDRTIRSGLAAGARKSRSSTA